MGLWYVLLWFKFFVLNFVFWIRGLGIVERLVVWNCLCVFWGGFVLLFLKRKEEVIGVLKGKFFLFIFVWFFLSFLSLFFICFKVGFLRFGLCVLFDFKCLEFNIKLFIFDLNFNYLLFDVSGLFFVIFVCLGFILLL